MNLDTLFLIIVFLYAVHRLDTIWRVLQEIRDKEGK